MLITRRQKQAFKVLMDSRSDDVDNTASDISIEHPNLASSPITSNFDSHLASKATSKTPSVVDLPAPTISAESTLDRETKSHLLWKAWRRVKYGSVAPSTVFTTRTRTSFRDSFVSRQSHVSLSTIAPLVEGEDNIFGRGITPSMSASNLGDPDVLERFKNLETNATLKSDYSDRIPQIPDLPSIPDLAEYEDILVSSLKYESAPRRRSRSLGSQESYRHRPERQRPRSTSAPSNLDNDSVSVTMEKTFPRQIYIPPPSPLRIQSMFPDSEVFGYSGSPTSSALFESDPASPCSIVDMAFFESTNDSDIPSVDRGLPEVPSRDY
ncbi:hypothetical protein BKA69DRAFT_488059 [Paraphysoderma sedebokerense]|nr:hypothetical protein BKA69DRAFT_488059 [Paraphysoderma sedebokerense]